MRRPIHVLCTIGAVIVAAPAIATAEFPVEKGFTSHCGTVDGVKLHVVKA